MHEFWKIGEHYRHQGYKGLDWVMVETEGEFVKLENTEGVAPFFLMVPKEQRPFSMYIKPF